ncbi:MAG: polyprenyl synthetase family protein, partial [Planctomycetes bacterium]|nr:polyprenyl synthetase family protein [Planctomycetota bacterium]
DDLPCMDDDDLRRGRPTCHKVYGEAMALLAGDALLTLAFEAVAPAGAEAVRVLAEAAGSRGMVGGQVADLAAEGAEPDLAAVEWIHDHKTGALIRASLLVGALAGGGATRDLGPLAEFGQCIGRAFQIADDCLDVTGNQQDLGKRPGQDEAARKSTYPAAIGLSASLQAAHALVGRAEELATEIGSWTAGGLESLSPLLRDAARFTVSRFS